MLDFHHSHILMPHKVLPQDEKLASTILQQCDQFSWMMMASYTICGLRHLVAVPTGKFNLISSFIYLFIYSFIYLFIYFVRELERAQQYYT